MIKTINKLWFFLLRNDYGTFHIFSLSLSYRYYSEMPILTHTYINALSEIDDADALTRWCCWWEMSATLFRFAIPYIPLSLCAIVHASTLNAFRAQRWEVHSTPMCMASTFNEYAMISKMDITTIYAQYLTRRCVYNIFIHRLKIKRMNMYVVRMHKRCANVIASSLNRSISRARSVVSCTRTI